MSDVFARRTVELAQPVACDWYTEAMRLARGAPTVKIVFDRPAWRWKVSLPPGGEAALSLGGNTWLWLASAAECNPFQIALALDRLDQELGPSHGAMSAELSRLLSEGST